MSHLSLAAYSVSFIYQSDWVENDTDLVMSEPEVTVLGGPDMFVETGSVINMTCSVAWTPAPPASTSWRHNNSLISFRGPRPGVSIIIDKGEITTAQLLIMSARSEIMMVTIIAVFSLLCLVISRSSDSGVYTCVPSNAPSANVTLHVLTGNLCICIFTMSCNTGAWILYWNKTNNFNRYK